MLARDSREVEMGAVASRELSTDVMGWAVLSMFTIKADLTSLTLALGTWNSGSKQLGFALLRSGTEL